VTEQKRMPMYTIGFDDPDARQAAVDIFYFQELDRQAELAIAAMQLAVMRGRDTRDPHDPKVWGALQNSLFAAICIHRILKPARVKGCYPGLNSHQESQDYADARGKRLREILGVADDSYILQVDKVRNEYEHYDESFDKKVTGGAECFSDWYITDQKVLRTPDDPSPTAVGLRVFFAAGGILYFEDKELMLFELQVEMIELRVKLARATREASRRVKGRGRFGGHNLHPLMSEARIQQRFDQWRHGHAEALEALEKEQMIDREGQ
jgi:hypothetical protein